ncbi:MAG: hypothetical protein QM532_03790 [Cyanobium sp. MAG06]|nr:hypothetical protein [Cyanobium sp. MAG06]
MLNNINKKDLYIVGKNYLGDHVCFLDLAEKYNRLTGCKSYIFSSGFNNAIKQITNNYNFVVLVDISTLLGKIHRIYLIFLSLFCRKIYYIPYNID